MKKGCNILILLLVILCIATTSSANAAVIPFEYTLQDVIEGATGSSSEIKKLDNKIRLADDNWSETNKNKSEGSGYEKEMNMEVNPLRAEIALEDLKWERTNKLDSIVNESTELYYKIILQGQLIDYQKIKIERLEKQIDFKKAKISAGVEAKYTLINDETALKEAKTELNRLINDEKNMKIQMNIKIGKQPRQEFILRNIDIPYEEYKVNDIDYVINQMIKENYTVKAIDKKITADVKERNLNKGYEKAQSDKGALKASLSGGTNHKSINDNLEDNLIKLKYDMKDEQDNIESKIREDYNNILNSMDDIETQKLECEKSVKLAEAELAKFKAGQTIELDYKKAQEDEKYSLYQYNKSKLNYYMSVQRFKDFIKYAVK